MKKKPIFSSAKLAGSCLTALFLAYIFYVGIYNLPKFLGTTGQFLGRSISLGQYIQQTDDAYESLMTTDDGNPLPVNLSSYANLHSAIAHLLGQPELNERVLLKNGHLAQWNETPADQDLLQVAADNAAALYQRTQTDGKDFLFLMTPAQLCSLEQLLPTGYTDCSNQDADRLLELLAQQNVPFLDLRRTMHDRGLSHEELFFRTDHHWTPEAGFWAYGEILQELSNRGYIGPVEEFYTDRENFEFTPYEDCFLGSSGKRTGIYFAGLDDFTVIRPKFDTHITVTYPTLDQTYSGTYFEAVNHPYTEAEMTKPNYFIMNHYGMYGRSDTAPVLRTNEAAPLDKKVLLLGDSFTNVPGSFLSLYAQRSLEADLRYYDGTFAELYEAFDPDLVLLMINPTGCTDTNATESYFP